MEMTTCFSICLTE